MKLFKKQKGFTLIELLVVIGILAILLAITLIAINPAKQFQQANDTQRRSDVNAVLNAVDQYMSDNQGALPAGLAAVDDGDSVAVSSAGTGAAFCNALVPEYLAKLPVDPLKTIGNCAAYDTGYTITKKLNKRITVSATPERSENIPIEVTR